MLAHWARSGGPEDGVSPPWSVAATSSDRVNIFMIIRNISRTRILTKSWLTHTDRAVCRFWLICRPIRAEGPHTCDTPAVKHFVSVLIALKCKGNSTLNPIPSPGSPWPPTLSEAQRYIPLTITLTRANPLTRSPQPAHIHRNPLTSTLNPVRKRM